MSVDLYWHEMPKEVRQIVEPLVQKHLGLLPRWLCCLAVRYGTGKPDHIAEVQVQPEYLQAKLFIGAAILDQTDADRERTIVHEFLHVALEPICDFTDHLMAVNLEEDARVPWQEQFRTKVMESVIQNLMYSLIPPAA